MPLSLTCPDDAELLAVASGDPPSAELKAHLADCPTCRKRLELLRVEVGLLRGRPPVAPLIPSTASDPAFDRSAANGRPVDSDATLPWQAAESGEDHAAEPETDPGFSDEAGRGSEVDFPSAISKYLVVGRFPPTGQADVYRVVHPGLDRDLVLKLARHPVEPGGQSEIIKEGRVLASLEHPHLVRVYDQDFHDNRPYLVMEFIRGRTLEQLANEERIAPRRAAALMAKVAGAVAAAHRQGIVHRDIKPKNILVDRSGEPRLIDFGLARLRHAYSDDPARPGGTFEFMAPEQAWIELPEEQAKVGPRSDVFALGAVLYWLLTGGPPFSGRNWRESMGRARRCDFDREALDNRTTPNGLRRICLEAMCADPAGRYNSAEALQNALGRFLAGPTIRAVAAGAAGLALVIALIVGIRSWLLDSSRSHGTGAIALQVTRGPSLYTDYQKALPLRTGDRLKIRCPLPHGARAVVFWVDSEGGVKELTPVAFRRDDGGNAVIYPEQGVARFEGAPGTELVVVCANRRRQAPSAEAATALADLGRLPELPENVRFRIGREGTRLLSDRGLGRVEADQLEAIRGKLERLRNRLRARFDIVEGLALPHENAN
jgi:predicted Ser/Thr protein kinase